jgi:arylsulfatase A-like enzyme
VFVNDVHLDDGAVSLGKVFRAAGYDTAYIGKWHLDGRGRSAYIPPESRQGFDYWKALECTHDYRRSRYYAGDAKKPRIWRGYDARAQTRDAERYIREHDRARPFLLALSWGPPHNPYDTAPAEHRRPYDPARIELRPNVPAKVAAEAREALAGYYAHCSALDACVGGLVLALDEAGIAEETVFVFTSDHGDMLGSQGESRKQKPWDESIRVPFLLRHAVRLGSHGRENEALVDHPDILPTLLGLCGLDIPPAVAGHDFTACLEGGDDPSGGSALLACYHPFGEWHRGRGGREFRGLRTRRHTYVRTLQGGWLLYDNQRDPFQLENLVKRPECQELRAGLHQELSGRLQSAGDEFLPGPTYIARWGYPVDERGTLPYER